jgi:hypothetical protein
VGELLYLFDQTRRDDVADQRDGGDQDRVNGEDDHRARRSSLALHRVDDRQERQREKQADRDQPDDDTDAPYEVQADGARGHDQHRPNDAPKRRRSQPDDHFSSHAFAVWACRRAVRRAR